MADIVEIVDRQLSDLLLNDIEPSVGRSRRVVNVTTTTDLPMGTVVFKAKDLDQEAPYAVLADPVTELVEGNEFAVVFGNRFEPAPVVKAETGGTTKTISFVGSGVVLKDGLVLEVNDIVRDSDEHKALVALLERQGIQMRKTLGQIFD